MLKGQVYKGCTALFSYEKRGEKQGRLVNDLVNFDAGI